MAVPIRVAVAPAEYVLAFPPDAATEDWVRASLAGPGFQRFPQRRGGAWRVARSPGNADAILAEAGRFAQPLPPEIAADAATAGGFGGDMEQLEKVIDWSTYRWNPVEQEIHDASPGLKNYQVVGAALTVGSPKVLNASRPGAGKTVMALAAIQYLKRRGRANRVLIVIPNNAKVTRSWLNEISKWNAAWGTALRCTLIQGSREERAREWAGDVLAPRRLTGLPGEGCAILNWEDLLTQDLDKFIAPNRWDVVVLDEVHHVKNFASKTLQRVWPVVAAAPAVIGMTGTPLENRPREMHTLLTLLDARLPDGTPVVGSWENYRDTYLENVSYGGKAPKYAFRPGATARLAGRLSQWAGFFRFNVENLPPLTIEEVSVHMTPAEQQRYNEIADSLVDVLQRLPDGQVQVVSRAGKDKRQAGQKVQMLKRMIADPSLYLSPLAQSSAKRDAFLHYIKTRLDEGAKALAFCDFKGPIDSYARALREEGVECTVIVGDVPQAKRGALLADFEHDPKKRVLLATTGCLGEAVNVQYCTTVLNIDQPWNATTYEQRFKRAWRTGQTQPVTVVNFIVRGAIDEDVTATIKAKFQVQAEVIDANETKQVDPAADAAMCAALPDCAAGVPGAEVSAVQVPRPARRQRALLAPAKPTPLPEFQREACPTCPAKKGAKRRPKPKPRGKQKSLGGFR